MMDGVEYLSAFVSVNVADIVDYNNLNWSIIVLIGSVSANF